MLWSTIYAIITKFKISMSCFGTIIIIFKLLDKSLMLKPCMHVSILYCGRLFGTQACKLLSVSQKSSIGQAGIMLCIWLILLN